MQSRQIQVFGVIGSAVLILFIVIFLGKDFHQLYLKYSGENLMPLLQDDHVVMEAEAVKNLTDHLNRESSQVLGSVRKKDLHSEKNIPGLKVVSEPATVKSEMKSMADNKQQKVAVTAENVSSAGAKSILSSKEALQVLNRELRILLRQTPFFRFSMALTPENKKVLDQVAARLSLLGFAFRVTVEGHTEDGISSGSSEAMAVRVGRYLKEKIPGLSVETVGYGNMYPVIDDPHNIENRRVEIIVRRSSE